jgi:small-conductance mechanosensitive channel
MSAHSLDYIRRSLHVEALLDRLQTATGMAEFALGLLLLLLAVGVARSVFQRGYSEQPERLERFFPYLGFRLALPLSGLVFEQLAAVAWSRFIGTPATILWSFAATLLCLAIVRVLTAMVRQALPSGKFERRTEQLLATVFWLGFVTWVIHADDLVIGSLEEISFRIGKSDLSLLTILSALWWLSIILIAALWVSRTLEARLMRVGEIDLNLRIVLSKLLRTALLVVAVLIALPVVGIDLTVLSVFSGALGIGLGFGLQKIASNYVSGFIILLDRSIHIGDRLMVDNKVGYVSKITARYVVLKGLDGSDALVPNDALISNTVINQSYTDKAVWISLPVAIDYRSDLELALKLLKEAGQHPRVVENPAPTPFVASFGENGIHLELGVWVSDPENGLSSLRSDINRAIWRKFKENGISIPYPQREVRLLADAEQHEAGG